MVELSLDTSNSFQQFTRIGVAVSRQSSQYAHLAIGEVHAMDTLWVLCDTLWDTIHATIAHTSIVYRQAYMALCGEDSHGV